MAKTQSMVEQQKRNSFTLCTRSKDEVERFVKCWQPGPACCWEDLEIVGTMLGRAKTPEHFGAIYVWFAHRMENRLAFIRRCRLARERKERRSDASEEV